MTEVTLLRLSDPTIKSITLSLSPGGGVDLDIDALKDDVAVAIRLVGCRELPNNFERLLSASWIEIIDDQGAQLEFGRFTLGFSDDDDCYVELFADSASIR
jgi:hypothetical protein